MIFMRNLKILKCFYIFLNIKHAERDLTFRINIPNLQTCLQKKKLIINNRLIIQSI